MSDPTPASLDQLSNFSVDQAGHLYWKGHEVITQIGLPWFVNLAVIVGGFSAAIAAAWPIVRFFLFDQRRPTPLATRSTDDDVT